MKNKFLTVASALLISSAISSSALARDGYYVAVRGGITNTNMNDIEKTAADKADISFDNVWMMSGAVGYRYSYFRAEVEYSYREDHEEEVDTGVSSKFGSENLMLNAYLDFMPNYVVSPYIMAGVGISRLNLETSSVVGPFTVTDSYDDDNLTWSVGAGLTVRVNKCLNLDGGYRYIDMGDVGEANVNAHEWYFGLRYTF